MKRLFGLVVLLAACTQRPELPAPVLPLTPSPDEPFRATPPAVEATPLDAPEVRSAVLTNGMRVLVVERPALPLVTLAWASRGARDGAELHERGLAALTARALTTGTRLGDGRELAHVRINGEVPRLSVGEDGTVISVHTPAAGLGVGIEVLAEVVRRPTFTAPGIQAARADQLEAMLWHSNRVDYELRDAALLGLFGDEHPPVTAFGRHADVIRFTRDAVTQFYATHYAPENSALVAVGAVTLEQMVGLAERHFGDWPRGDKPVSAAAPLALLAPSKRIQGIAGGGHQAWFTLALPCPAAGDAHEADFDLLGMVLGNLPLSRTTRLLRHEEGIAYAVSARCEETSSRGTFWVEFSVDPERGGDALTLVLKEIGRLRTEDIPSTELELAKIQLLGRFGGGLSTNAGILQAVAGDFLRGQPPDGIARWLDAVRAATSARVRESARLYFTGHVGIATYGPRDLVQFAIAPLGGADWWEVR
ncbi:MAG TPA: pitrilysin family protein [Polyangiaceae bacterium]|nr:pitrilysin family protein [Polyangiaceae bacterium]